jgi:hypothetical protein
VYAHTRSRVRHQDPSTPWLESYSYSDGFSRIALTKAQAEPGAAPQRDANGDLVRDGSGALVFADTASRWVGTGLIVFDNKANPVKSYEPFFDSTPAYESEIDLVQWGVTSITRYDALSRMVRVDKPDGTYTAVDFGPWRQLSSDENDNVLASAWYSARIGGGLGAAQQDAATKAAAQAQTRTCPISTPSGASSARSPTASPASSPSGMFSTSRPAFGPCLTRSAARP